MSRFRLTEAQFERRRRFCLTRYAVCRSWMIEGFISRIIHVLKSGGRWVDPPVSYGPKKTLCNRFVRWAAKGIWQDIFGALASAGGLLIDSTHMKAHRSAAGGKAGAVVQAIGISRGGISRGGISSKLHAPTHREGRPIRFIVTGADIADCKAATTLVTGLTPDSLVHADKAYDSNVISNLIERQGAVPNISPKGNRRWKSCCSKTLYQSRDAVERMVCRFKTYRRIATRYD